MPRLVTEQDLEDLARGAAVLGTGGGGNPYIGKLIAQQAGKTLGLTVPKGASPKVIDTGRLLVSRMGAEGLKDYAKVSFKTMDKVLAGTTP